MTEEEKLLAQMLGANADRPMGSLAAAWERWKTKPPYGYRFNPGPPARLEVVDEEAARTGRLEIGLALARAR